MARVSLQALNRATLARQMLLAREAVGPVAAVERLVAMQAQLARPPFVGLWSRIAGFERAQLHRAIADRELVRATSLRCTLHLMSARDYLAFRATLEPMLEGALQGILGDRTAALDLEALVAETRAFMRDSPRTFDEVRAHLLALHPGEDERAMGYSVRTRLPLVQVPTDAPWAFPGKAAFTPAASWLGAEPDGEDRSSELVRRYLAAFGPATPQDMQVWSGLKGLKGAFEALRPELVVLEDETGRELFDLPGAPRPEADTEAPVRFLPEFDNLFLSHADRSRIMTEADRKRVYKAANLQMLPTFLVDGRLAGAWAIATKRGVATLTLTSFAPLSGAVREALAQEGEALSAFMEPQAKARDVVFESA